jgi:hypothetical protein
LHSGGRSAMVEPTVEALPVTESPYHGCFIIFSTS